jgi:hypothetical protein
MNRTPGGKNNGGDSVINKTSRIIHQSKFNRGLPGMTGRAIGAGRVAGLLLLATGAGGMAGAAATGYLSDQPELIESSTQGWGALGFDADAGGSPLQIGEKHFVKGLGTHANGVMVLRADGQYESFDSEVGLQPCAGGMVIFRVLVDGQQAFDSGVMRSGDAPKAVHVLVAGVQEIRLESKAAGDDINCDMANWAEARLTPAPNARIRPAEHVDMARFARVVTWDPERLDGARASRTDEFRAEDVFTETDLLPNRDGHYTVPIWTKGTACIGLQWLNRRVLREVALEFAEGTLIPAPDSVRVEGWFGESAWQGNWKPLTNECRQEEGRLVFKLAPRGGAVETQKVRWILPASSKPLLVGLSAWTRSSWTTTNLLAQMEDAKAGARGEVTVWNGELAAKPGIRNPKSEISWRLSEPLRLSVRFAGPSSVFKSDPTELRFRLPTGNVTVAVQDVLANECVYVPDYGLFVAREPLPITLADYKRGIAGKKTILEEVRAMPDQTLAQAMAKTHHDFQNEGPVALSLACDNAKFVVERDGTVRFQISTNAVGGWFASAGEMAAHFGGGQPGTMTRTLEGGWLPIPIITMAKEGLILRQRSFVAPCDEPGSEPARLNRRSVFVAEVTLTNTLAQPADATLSLNFLLNTAQKKSARLTSSSRGWVVQGDSGEIGLIAADRATPLTLTASNGALSLTGKLSPRQAARLTVFLQVPGQPTDLASLPNAAELRAETEAYWNAVLAPAMQVETPDALLNEVIRSSQVRCLIAARNEADGARVAAWIAAMSYGPLESEAHSVIRGMDFMGHEDFARRSLDFFVHRYNTNGFLTTGYTTFGTGWHLWTLAQHYQLSRDENWLRQVAPEIARVGHWIVRQAEKTKKLDAQGEPVPEYGLMPPGVLADWNAYACHFSMNAYYFAALRGLGDALGDIGHPDADFFKGHAAELRANTLRAYAWTQARSPVLALRDGTWIPAYPSQVHSPGKLGDFFPGQDAGRSWCYDVEIGAHQLAPAGILDPDSREMTRILDHMEDVQFLADGWFDYPATMNQGDWFNLGGFSKVQPFYTRTGEVYALRDDVKPFVRSYFNSLAAMLNREVLTFWEHFHAGGAWDKTHETGFFLYRTRTMLVQERGDELWLAPFATSNWLGDGQRVAVENAPTFFGKVSYQIQSHATEGYIEATIHPPTRQAAADLVLRLRHPEGKLMRAVTVNGQPHTDFDPREETIRIVPDGAAPIVVRASY